MLADMETKVLNVPLPKPIMERVKRLAKKRGLLMSAVWLEAAKLWIEAQANGSR